MTRAVTSKGDIARLGLVKKLSDEAALQPCFGREHKSPKSAGPHRASPWCHRAGVNDMRAGMRWRTMAQPRELVTEHGASVPWHLGSPRHGAASARPAARPARPWPQERHNATGASYQIVSDLICRKC